MKTVYWATNIFDGETVAAYLRAHNIDAFLPERMQGTAAAGELAFRYRVSVPPAQVEAALNLIEALDNRRRLEAPPPKSVTLAQTLMMLMPWMTILLGGVLLISARGQFDFLLGCASILMGTFWLWISAFRSSRGTKSQIAEGWRPGESLVPFVAVHAETVDSFSLTGAAKGQAQWALQDFEQLLGKLAAISDEQVFTGVQDLLDAVGVDASLAEVFAHINQDLAQADRAEPEDERRFFALGDATTQDWVLYFVRPALHEQICAELKADAPDALLVSDT